jgi:hypothetical protein
MLMKKKIVAILGTRPSLCLLSAAAASWRAI